MHKFVHPFIICRSKRGSEYASWQEIVNPDDFSKCRIWIVFKFYNSSLIHRLLHIDQALVTTTSEKQISVSLGKNERAIDQYLNIG